MSITEEKLLERYKYSPLRFFFPRAQARSRFLWFICTVTIIVSLVVSLIWGDGLILGVPEKEDLNITTGTLVAVKTSRYGIYIVVAEEGTSQEIAFPRRGGFIASIKKAREIEPEMLGSSVRVAWVRNVSPFGLGWFRDYRDIWELEINNKIIISFDDLSTHAREYFPTMKLTFFISLAVAAIALAILFNLNRKRDPA